MAPHRRGPGSQRPVRAARWTVLREDSEARSSEAHRYLLTVWEQMVAPFRESFGLQVGTLGADYERAYLRVVQEMLRLAALDTRRTYGLTEETLPDPVFAPEERRLFLQAPDGRPVEFRLDWGGKKKPACPGCSQPYLDRHGVCENLDCTRCPFYGRRMPT